MAKQRSAELHIIINKEGVTCVQIVGPIETHPEGHALYCKILDLVQKLDKEMQERLKKEDEKSELNA